MTKAQENAEPPASGLGFGHLVNLHHSTIVSRYGGQGWGWAFLQVEGWRCVLVSTRAEANDALKLPLQALIIMIQHGQEGHFGDSGMYVCVCGFDDHWENEHLRFWVTSSYGWNRPPLQASSGHLGTPFGCAPLANALCFGLQLGAACWPQKWAQRTKPSSQKCLVESVGIFHSSIFNPSGASWPLTACFLPPKVGQNHAVLTISKAGTQLEWPFEESQMGWNEQDLFERVVANQQRW